MAAACIDPFAVESVEFIVIMYTLILSEVESRERDRKTVLAMFQTDLLTTVENHLDRTVFLGAYQLVVDLQVAEHQRDIPQCVDIGRVEHRDSISASKHQTAVRQLTRGTIHKLVACQSIGLIERGDTSCLGVQTVQTLHRTDPEVSLASLLDARHIRTRQSSYTCYLVGLGVIAQQTVAHGSYPHVALLVLMHVCGDIHTATDALLHVRNLHLRQFASLGIHP